MQYGSLYVSTPDAAVALPATASTPAQIFQLPLEPLVGPVSGMSMLLMQNAFATNTALFQFDGDYRFRFVLANTFVDVE